MANEDDDIFKTRQGEERYIGASYVFTSDSNEIGFLFISLHGSAHNSYKVTAAKSMLSHSALDRI